MQEQGKTWEDIKKSLFEKKELDTSYNKVLSSMCTYPHPIAIKAHNLFIESNIGDYGLFMGTYELEREVIRMLGSLLSNSDACGYLTTGGTESNIQAIRAMRNIRKEITNPNIVISESAHFSFDKIADILNIQVLKAKLLPNLQVNIDHFRSLINENTVGIVGIVGTTEFGQVDNIVELSKIAIENKIFLHIDAAYGGFVFPFFKPHLKFDFSLPGVTSITVDPHKMGLSIIPTGGLLFKDEKMIQSLKINTPYLTISTQNTLTGTRSGASVAATYAVMKYLGKSGYKEIINKCMELTNLLISEAEKIDLYPVITPTMNIVNFDVPYPVEEIRKKIFQQFGWRISVTKNNSFIRLVIMPHMTESLIINFVKDLKSILKKSYINDGAEKHKDQNIL